MHVSISFPMNAIAVKLDTSIASMVQSSMSGLFFLGEAGGGLRMGIMAPFRSQSKPCR